MRFPSPVTEIGRISFKNDLFLLKMSASLFIVLMIAILVVLYKGLPIMPGLLFSLFLNIFACGFVCGIIFMKIVLGRYDINYDLGESENGKQETRQ